MRLAHGIIVLSLALVPLACGGGSDDAPAPAPKPAPTPSPAPTPEPPAASEPSAAAGAAHYATFCASCHGPKGDGDGPVSAGLNPKPARHSDAAYMSGLTDDYLFKVIKEGGAAVGKSPLMAPWGGMLSDAQVRDVVAFVRTLAK
ncbi:MAG: cytochrome c [Deltaproteobacteria bacterium]|nr:cytochrome c [Deltaproteobacteria bacterium]MBW2445106.1 cytochrome c [Deltaproteobacteria bacterium]